MTDPRQLSERERQVMRRIDSRRSLAVLLLMSLLLPSASLAAQQPSAGQEPAAPGGPARATREGRDIPPQPPATRPAMPGPRFGGRGGFGGVPAAPALGEGPSCTIDATVYDVRMAADMIGLLELDTLTRASATPQAFEKELAALGATKPLYRVSQSVRLSGDMILIGTEVPVVTNTRMTDRGQAINSVQYRSTGAVFTVAGRAGAPGGIDLDLGIEVAASSEGGAAVAEQVKAPIMRKATLSHKGPFQPGKPFILISVDAASADNDGKAVAYIARITMGEPQAPAPK